MEPRRTKPSESAGRVERARAKEGVGEHCTGKVEQLVYELDTPMWHKYYQQVRKTIRFPRYYKKDLNW